MMHHSPGLLTSCPALTLQKPFLNRSICYKLQHPGHPQCCDTVSSLWILFLCHPLSAVLGEPFGGFSLWPLGSVASVLAHSEAEHPARELCEQAKRLTHLMVDGRQRR